MSTAPFTDRSQRIVREQLQRLGRIAADATECPAAVRRHRAHSKRLVKLVCRRERKGARA